MGGDGLALNRRNGLRNLDAVLGNGHSLILLQGLAQVQVEGHIIIYLVQGRVVLLHLADQGAGAPHILEIVKLALQFGNFLAHGLNLVPGIGLLRLNLPQLAILQRNAFFQRWFIGCAAHWRAAGCQDKSGHDGR